jgi:hypothetical protein
MMGTRDLAPMSERDRHHRRQLGFAHLLLVFAVGLGGCRCGLRPVEECRPPACPSDGGTDVDGGKPGVAIAPTFIALVAGSQTSFAGIGGVPPYAFSVVSGGGAIEGTSGLYTAPGSFGTAVVRVTDAIGSHSDADVTVKAALAIVPMTKRLRVGTQFAFSATGGGSPYAFSLVSGAGTLDATTGLYTAPGTAGAAVVRVTDVFGNTAEAGVAVFAALSIAPSSKTLAVGTPFTFTAAGGVAPYAFSVSSGAGTIGATSGVFAAPITGASTVRVTDLEGTTADATVTVNEALTISPATRALNIGDTASFTATGGVGPYAYSLLSGVGSMDAATGLYVAPTSAGSAVVRVTDRDGTTADASITVVGLFAAAVNYSVGSGPLSVTKGHWNADAHEDLAVANRSSSEVSILLGTGIGTFLPATSFSWGSQPTSVTGGDWNADGKTDLAVTLLGSGEVAILLGLGTGAFQPPVTYPVGMHPFSVITGDWNNDGKADLAVANSLSATLSILLGVGDGTFQAASVVPAPGTSPHCVTGGDWNGDGKADLALTGWPNGNDDLSIYLGVGDGTFLPPAHHSVGAQAYAVASGDWNGDGKPDLAVTDASGIFTDTVNIFIGNGDGTFQPPTKLGTGGAPTAVVTSDWNGDGKADLAIANYNSGSVSILIGVGNGTFTSRVNYPSGAGSESIAHGDWNGDGKPDLAIANNGANNISILLNTSL